MLITQTCDKINNNPGRINVVSIFVFQNALKKSVLGEFRLTSLCFQRGALS